MKKIESRARFKMSGNESQKDLQYYHPWPFGFYLLTNSISFENARYFYGNYCYYLTKDFRSPERLQFKIILAIMFMLFYGQAFAFYPSKWADGYFGQSENWIPWDSSCKTWSNSTTWDSCEDFMRKNDTTGLWETCSEGEYYDSTGDSWLPWNGVWIRACSYQASWFECPLNEILDIDTLECVNSCSSDKIEVISNRMNIKKICKTPSIYVDPASQKSIEFGTSEFPYRTFKSAASEIINHYSNKNVEMEIFVKDGFIEMDTFYFINMTSIKITAHPDYQLSNRRAQISFTSQSQHGISKRASFHLLKDAYINLEDVITVGQFGEREISELSKINVGLMLARTNLEISQIDVHSSELKFFWVPVYLQEKQVKLCKFDSFLELMLYTLL